MQMGGYIHQQLLLATGRTHHQLVQSVDCVHHQLVLGAERVSNQSPQVEGRIYRQLLQEAGHVQYQLLFVVVLPMSTSIYFTLLVVHTYYYSQHINRREGGRGEV